MGETGSPTRLEPWRTRSSSRRRAWPGSRCALRLADAGGRVTVIATGAGSLQLGGATIDVLGYAPDRVERPLEASPALARRPPVRAARRADGSTPRLRGWRERLPATRPARFGTPRTCCSPPRSARSGPTAVAPAAIAAGDLRRGGQVVFASVRGAEGLRARARRGERRPCRRGRRSEARACDADVAVERRGRRLAARPRPRARAIRDARAADAALARADRRGRRRRGSACRRCSGVDRHAEVAAAVADALGGEVFEVPTPPPSVPGIRLYRALTAELRKPEARLDRRFDRRRRASRDGDRVAGLEVHVAGRTRTFPADAGRARDGRPGHRRDRARPRRPARAGARPGRRRRPGRAPLRRRRLRREPGRPGRRARRRGDAAGRRRRRAWRTRTCTRPARCWRRRAVARALRQRPRPGDRPRGRRRDRAERAA